MSLPPLDGDGWITCAAGHRHWGRYGAAGMLVSSLDDTGRPVVLLQHRSEWVHHGGTWGVPGGARASTETPEQAARRETAEELHVDLTDAVVDRRHVDDHGGWAYTTVLAVLPSPVPASGANAETADVRWIPIDEVARLPLHPGFAASWPALQPLPHPGSAAP